MSDEEDAMQFDEFGNPINGFSSDSESDSETEELLKKDIDLDGELEQRDHEGDTEMKDIVLSEDKTYYPSLSETFGPEVETIIASSDAKSLHEPIVTPQMEKKFMFEERSLPETTYSKEYLWEMSRVADRVRNVALVGNLHSGKTSILDMLITQTHNFSQNKDPIDDKPLRYTDNHILESKRGISIKSTTMSLLLPDLRDANMMVNVIDAPGHTNFVDEMSVAVRMADIAFLCVDVVESVTESLELAIEYSLKTNTKMVLLITKIDRLILELRLPPLEAYYKIRSTIDEVNKAISTKCKALRIDGVDMKLSPELNNVLFSSSVFSMIFSLTSFTHTYFQANQLDKNPKVSVDSFARKLWGDVYYENKKFFVRPKNLIESANSRTFIKFILAPIYKLTTASISLDADDLQAFVESKMRLRIHRSKYKLDTKVFFKELFKAFLGEPSKAFVHLLSHHPSPADHSVSKLNYLYTGLKESEIADHITRCDPVGPLIAYVSKLVDTKDGENFYAFVRILSGSLKSNSTVKLLGEDYSVDNTNDFKDQKINKCYLWCGRYKVSVPELNAGSIGLVAGPGIDQFIVKTATIYDLKLPQDSLHIIKKSDELISPVYKVSLQSYNPKDLNRFLDSLKKINRSYLGCDIKIEDNGENSILGYGELYMDCLLHDLRILYGNNLDIKVSDPMVKFHETTDSISRVKLTIHSSNGKNSISIISEPLDAELSKDIANGLLNVKYESPRTIAKKLRNIYGWNSLSARSVWSLGPNEENGTCLLCNDTISEEVDTTLLHEYKDVILKGFQWAVKEGPLCEEPINNVRFKIIDINFADEEIDRNKGQIIQMVRNACHAAILIGEPSLLEPIYKIELLINTIEILDTIKKVIEKRRGFITDEIRIDGSPMWKIVGFLPVIESVGLEVDIRLFTRGLAYPQLIFHKWEIVPGNPLDPNVFLPNLKRVPLQSIGRDFMLKTRRRKGLSDEVTLEKYVDSDTWMMIKELDIL